MIRPLTSAVRVSPLEPHPSQSAGHLLQEVPDPLAAWPRLLAGRGESAGPIVTAISPSLVGPTVLRLSPDGIWEGGRERPREERGPVWLASSAIDKGHPHVRSPFTQKLHQLEITVRELGEFLQVRPNSIVHWFDGRNPVPDGVRMAIETAPDKVTLLSDLGNLYEVSGRTSHHPLRARDSYWNTMHQLERRMNPDAFLPETSWKLPRPEDSLRRLGITEADVMTHLAMPEGAILHWRDTRGLVIELVLAKAANEGEAFYLLDLLFEKKGRDLARRETYWATLLEVLARPLPPDAEVAHEIPVYAGRNIEADLKARLETWGISRSEVARRLGLAPGTVNDWFHGNATPEGFYLAVVKADLPEDLFFFLNLLWKKGVSPKRELQRAEGFWPTIGHLRQLPDSPITSPPITQPGTNDLRAALQRLSLRQIDLIRILGVYSSSVVSWYHGTAQPPEDLCQVLDRSQDRDEAIALLNRVFEGDFRGRRYTPPYWRALSEIQFSSDNPRWRETLEIYQAFGRGRILRGEVQPRSFLSASERLHQGARLRAQLARLQITETGLASLLDFTVANISAWLLGHSTPPLRLLPLLDAATEREEALYRINDLIERTVRVYQRRHPYWGQALRLRGKLKKLRLGLSEADFFAAAVDGDVDLSPVLPVIEEARDADQLLSALVQLRKSRLKKPLPPLTPRIARPPTPPPQIRETPRRPLTPAEWAELHTLLTRYDSFIRYVARGQFHSVGSGSREGDIEEVITSVQRDLERLILRGETIHTVHEGLIQLIVSRRTIDLLRKKSGLTRDQWMKFRLLSNLEKEKGRPLAPEDLEERFELSREDATLYLEYYGNLKLKVRFASLVQFDEGAHDPSADT